MKSQFISSKKAMINKSQLEIKIRSVLLTFFSFCFRLQYSSAQHGFTRCLAVRWAVYSSTNPFFIDEETEAQNLGGQSKVTEVLRGKTTFKQINKRSFLLALTIKIKSTPTFKTGLQVIRPSDIIHNLKFEIKLNVSSSSCVHFIFKGPCRAKSVSVQFSSVAQTCPTLCDPMNRSTPGLPVHHQLSEFTQTHVHRVSDAIQPSHPLSSPSPPAPNPSQHQSLFQWVISLYEVAKVLEFQL